MKGINEAKGTYVIMGDADDSYDFSSLNPFLKKLREGYDVVMGSRLKGKIEKGAMPLLHRLGNPLMTGILNIFFKTRISDAHCGLRAFRKDSFLKMNLITGGMEFASEFVVKAVKEKLKIAEVPITLYRDGRTRRPHLRTFYDGWRHLRFLLIYSPTYLFLFPGLLLFLTGSIFVFGLTIGNISIGGHFLGTHFNILGAVLCILGTQFIMLGLFSRIFAYIKKFDKHDIFIKWVIEAFSLEKGIYFGLVPFIIGLGIFVHVLVKWIASGFGVLLEVETSLAALTLVVIGIQIIMSSFFVSLLVFDDRDIMN